MTPPPGTVQTASGANTSRSGKPCFSANASKIRRTTASLSAFDTALPLVEEPVDVTPLRLREVERREEPPRLGGVVVRRRGLEVRALRGRLSELAPQPAEEAHAGLLAHPAHYASRVDTLLAIASRRDERRYEPDPLPDALVTRI